MWVDVKPSDWYYNEVMEASKIYLEDGQPFVASIPYNKFNADAPYVFKEFEATNGQTEFILPVLVTPTPANPLYVYIDGVQSVYKELLDEGGVTKVVLYTPPIAGTTVTFASYGKPLVDDFGKPSVGNPGVYPMGQLSVGGSYVYDPFNRAYQETAYAFGKQLKRVHIDETELATTDPAILAQKYIGYASDKYFITPTGLVVAPYSLADIGVSITYLENSTGWTKPKTEKITMLTSSVLHVNRFFPNAYITRAEVFIWINRLRETFYSRFTDIEAPTNILDDTQFAYLGQTTFRVNGYYPAGQGLLDVSVNDVLLHSSEYIEVDNRTVMLKVGVDKNTKVNFYYEKLESDRFPDVGQTVTYSKTDGTTVSVNGTLDQSWWAAGILAIEDETFDNGDYLVSGMPVNASGSTVTVDNMLNPVGTPNDVWLMANTCMTRAEVVTYLNRFRKWCIERLK